MIFVDTSFWTALQLRRDSHHADARELLRRHGDTPWVTTDHIRGETWTVLRGRAGHRAAVSFLDLLERTPRVEIARVGEDVEGEALTWLRRHDERIYSFVDAASFAFMRKRRVGEVLAFDSDFSAAGFVELRP